jgi:hypothetical protein
MVYPLHEEPAAALTPRDPTTREWSDCRPGARSQGSRRDTRLGLTFQITYRKGYK